jgi:predicted dehydrogenase
MALEIAFYGAGALARPYLDALGRRADVHVKAVCDVDRRAAEQTAAGWGARVFLSYEAMLEEADPNALWVCVPPHLQGDVILRAAERAIPFFVEPPGAVTYERARLLTCAAFARPEPRIELELLGEGWSLGFGRDLATLRVDERDKTTILRCLNSPAEQQAGAFVEAVMNDKPSPGLVTYADALRTLAVCQAAAVSAREGRAVEVAEVEHLQAGPEPAKVTPAPPPAE